MTTDLCVLEARELVRKYAEENARLKQEIRLAGGHLQRDGRYRWEYFSGPEGSHTEVIPTSVWITRRRQDAAFLYQLFGMWSPSNDRPTPVDRIPPG